MGKGKMQRNFERAYELFTQALEIDKKDKTANYCLGLMHMLGLVPNEEPNADYVRNSTNTDLCCPLKRFGNGCLS